MQTIPADITIKTLFTEFLPEQVKAEIASRKPDADLDGSEITMVIEVSGDYFGYRVKDGKTIEVQNTDIENAMVRLKVDADELSRMIAAGNIDMITGIMVDLNPLKVNTLKTLKGTFTAKLAGDDGSIFHVLTMLNGAQEPSSVFKMSVKDSSALVKKETNPVNLFMSGAMQIEGDMAFAMATQPLFT